MQGPLGFANEHLLVLLIEKSGSNFSTSKVETMNGCIFSENHCALRKDLTLGLLDARKKYSNNIYLYLLRT